MYCNVTPQCYTLQCYTLQCYTLQCYTLQCFTLQCYTLQCYTLQCYTLQCYTLHCYTLQCYTLDCYTLQCYTIQCYTLQCYTLHCYTLQCYTLQEATYQAKSNNGNADAIRKSSRNAKTLVRAVKNTVPKLPCLGLYVHGVTFLHSVIVFLCKSDNVAVEECGVGELLPTVYCSGVTIKEL